MGTPVYIIGLNKDDDPALYESIERTMRLFGLQKVRVDIKKRVSNAQGKSMLLEDHLIFSPEMLKLMKSMDRKEVESILAHEISHIYYRDYHVLSGLMLIFTIPFIALCVYYFIFGSLLGYGIGLSYDNAWFWILLLLFIFGLRIVFWTSRQFEARADREAVLKVKEPEALKSALARLTGTFVATPKRPGLLRDPVSIIIYVFFYVTGTLHPSLKERFEQIDLVNYMFIGQRSPDVGPLIRPAEK